MTALNRTKDNPWRLKTPPGSSEYTMHVEEKNGRQVLVCTVGTTVLEYDARCVDDLHTMLKAAGGWVELGGADEQKAAKDGTVEAVGAIIKQPHGRMVWTEERSARALRRLRTAVARRVGSVRARAQSQK